jgi:hypothetical protein
MNQGVSGAGSEDSNEENHRGIASEVRRRAQPRPDRPGLFDLQGGGQQVRQLGRRPRADLAPARGPGRGWARGAAVPARGQARGVRRARPLRHPQALKRKGVTLQLLWSEYVAVHGERAYRYSQFCHRYHQWRAMQKRSMRQHHRAGEKLFIDYAGPTVEVIDRATGEVRQAGLRRGARGLQLHLRRGHLEPVAAGLDRRAPARAAFFGGVPQLLVPDNLRAAVTQAAATSPGSTPPTRRWPRTTAPRCFPERSTRLLMANGGFRHRLPLRLNRYLEPALRCGSACKRSTICGKRAERWPDPPIV